MTATAVDTTVINLTGSLVLGLLIGVARSHLASHAGLLILGTAASLAATAPSAPRGFETVQLLGNHRYHAALINFGTLVAATASAALDTSSAWPLHDHRHQPKGVAVPIGTPPRFGGRSRRAGAPVPRRDRAMPIDPMAYALDRRPMRISRSVS